MIADGDHCQRPPAVRDVEIVVLNGFGIGDTMDMGDDISFFKLLELFDGHALELVFVASFEDHLQ